MMDRCLSITTYQTKPPTKHSNLRYVEETSVGSHSYYHLSLKQSFGDTIAQPSLTVIL